MLAMSQTPFLKTFGSSVRQVGFSCFHQTHAFHFGGNACADNVWASLQEYPQRGRGRRMARASGWAAFCSTGGGDGIKRLRQSRCRVRNKRRQPAVYLRSACRFCQHDGIDRGQLLPLPPRLLNESLFHRLALTDHNRGRVARPSAHGRAITKTATACISATVQSHPISLVTIKVKAQCPRQLEQTP